MRTSKNTFTIFAVLLIVLILFCITRSEGVVVVPDGFATLNEAFPGGRKNM